jgi:hypothetical protein
MTETTVAESTDKTPQIDETTINEYTKIHIPDGAIPIKVKISHYNPDLGGVNCGNWYDGGCQSHLAGGGRWQDYIDEGQTIACPMSVPFGSEVYLDNIKYTCRDRGGAIVITPEGYYWIDILEKHASYPFGTVKDAWLYIK